MRGGRRGRRGRCGEPGLRVADRPVEVEQQVAGAFANAGHLTDDATLLRRLDTYGTHAVDDDVFDLLVDGWLLEEAMTTPAL